MTYGALRLVPRPYRRPLPAFRRSRRPVRHPGALSVAGLAGVPVRDGTKALAGRLADVVVRWGSGSAHPSAVAVVVRAGRARHYVPLDAVARLEQDGVTLTGPLPGTQPRRAPEFVALVHDVLDHQLVDTDGVNVVRVSDLILADCPHCPDGPDGVRLVGVDVSLRTLLRRLGPAPLRRVVAQDRVYDWNSVVAFSGRQAGETGATLLLDGAVARLRTLPPADLDALLGRLPARSGSELAAQLGTEQSS
jgi:hypothetical protein